MAAQDLNGAIDWSAVACLNQKPDHTVQNALKQGWVCRARSAAAAPCRGCCDRWASGRLLLRARGRLCLPVPREPNKSLAAVPAAAAGRRKAVARDAQYTISDPCILSICRCVMSHSARHSYREDLARGTDEQLPVNAPHLLAPPFSNPVTGRTMACTLSRTPMSSC